MLCAADFEKALGLRPCVKSAHFFVHHLPLAVLAQSQRRIRSAQLSTAAIVSQGIAVDDSVADALAAPRVQLGMVVPKRHAKRAATRNLLKRQIRATFSEQVRCAGLRAGGWVVRLRTPFDRARFDSAQSEALAAAVRTELIDLMQRAGTFSAP